MDMGTLVVTLLCAAVSFVLLVATMWFRWGRSRAARWWVRTMPVEQTGPGQGAIEAMALWFTPWLAQVFAVIALVCAVAVLPWTHEHLFTPVMWTAVILECVLGIVMAVSVGHRELLPIWSYPGWLRPTRRLDRQRLDAEYQRRRQDRRDRRAQRSRSGR